MTGLDLWRLMPTADASLLPVEAGGTSRLMTVSGGALAMAVPHPASFGFTYEPWHTLIRAFLARSPP